MGVPGRSGSGGWFDIGIRGRVALLFRLRHRRSAESKGVRRIHTLLTCEVRTDKVPLLNLFVNDDNNNLPHPTPTFTTTRPNRRRRVSISCRLRDDELVIRNGAYVITY